MNWDLMWRTMATHVLPGLAMGIVLAHVLIPRWLSRELGIKVRARDPYVRAWKRWRNRRR